MVVKPLPDTLHVASLARGCDVVTMLVYDTAEQRQYLVLVSVHMTIEENDVRSIDPCPQKPGM